MELNTGIVNVSWSRGWQEAKKIDEGNWQILDLKMLLDN